MADALSWTRDNWWPILLGFFAVVQVVNKATERWDEFAGPTWKRFLLLLSEMGSVVVSKGYRGTLGPFKLPINPYGGRLKGLPPTFPPPGASALFLCAALGGLPMVPGCASSWSDNANKGLKAAHEMAKGGWGAARVVFQARCSTILEHCDVTAELVECGPYEDCKASRRNYSTAFAGVQEMIAQATDSLESFERLKKAADGETVEGPEMTGSEMAKRQADVNEKILRAQRGAVELVRDLRKDGLVK